MNASKSTDTYTSYSGVTLEESYQGSHARFSTGITVFLQMDSLQAIHSLQAPILTPINVFGTYPSSMYYYNEQADVALNPSTGWADYSSPSCEGRNNGDPI